MRLPLASTFAARVRVPALPVVVPGQRYSRFVFLAKRAARAPAKVFAG